MAKLLILTGRPVKSYVEMGDEVMEGAVLQACGLCGEPVFVSAEGIGVLKEHVAGGNEATVFCSRCAERAVDKIQANGHAVTARLTSLGMDRVSEPGSPAERLLKKVRSQSGSGSQSQSGDSKGQ